MGRSHVEIDQAKLAVILQRKTHELASHGADMAILRVKGNILGDGLVDTGRLLNSWRKREVSSGPLATRFEVYSTDPAAIYPEEGTRGATARPGGWLVFKPKGATTFVFAKHTRGIRAYHFLRRAKQSLTKKDFTG